MAVNFANRLITALLSLAVQKRTVCAQVPCSQPIIKVYLVIALNFLFALSIA